MTEIILTPEQMAVYKRIVDELENLRSLTDWEKERLIRDIMEKPFLDLLCDVAFKYVFQQDMESLKMLLNDFLPERIVSVSTKPNELVSPVAGDKKPVLDILAETDDGRKILWVKAPFRAAEEGAQLQGPRESHRDLLHQLHFTPLRLPRGAACV